MLIDEAANLIMEKAASLRREEGPLVIALDGRCASGKTTLAGRLRELMDCAVFHMDDYFPRPEQRTERRLSAPGSNVDHERFLSEVLIPLRSGAEEICFRPFDCHKMELAQPVKARVTPTVVVEGSYSCHPTLWDCYDLRVFLTVTPEEQLRRIALRNGPDGLKSFRERWIPMEERYFSAFRIMERCDIVVGDRE